MSFIPDISKQAHKTIDRKRSIATTFNFSSIPVARTNSQKYLGMQLDKKLNFGEYFSKVESKVIKTIGIIRKLQNFLARLDYGEIIYDKAFNESFQTKLESLQYNATLTITGTIRVSSTKTFLRNLS